MSENEQIVESTLQKLESGEVNYHELDHRSKEDLKSKVYDELDDRHKNLWQHGWKPKPLFLGKDRNGNDVPWKTADEFEEAFKIPQIAKEREIKLADENRKLREELDKVSNLTRFTAERSILADEERINAEIKQAKELSDIDSYERALEKKKILDQEKNKINKYSEQPNYNNIIDQLIPEDREAFLNFKVDVPHFGSDPIVTQFAIKEWEQIQNTNSLSFAQKLDFIKRRTAANFPDRFSKPATFMPTTTTINNNKLSTSEKPKMTFEKLSESDKIRVDRMVLSKKFPNREAVIKQFFK